MTARLPVLLLALIGSALANPFGGGPFPSGPAAPGVLPTGSVSTSEIADDAVTYAKIQNVSADDRILGLDAAGAGDVEELALGSGLGMSAANTVGITDVELTSIAGLTSAADRVPYYTGSGTAALATFTAAGRSMVGAADAAAQTALLSAATSTVAGTTKLKPFVLSYYFTGSGAGTAWTNASPSGDTQEWLAGTWRKAFDSTNFTEVHLEFYARSAAPASGFVVGLECSVDGGTNWLFVDDGTSAGSTASPGEYGAHAPVATWASAVAFESTGYTTIHANCRGDYFWRMVGDVGDGAADPAAAYADIWFR